MTTTVLSRNIKRYDTVDKLLSASEIDNKHIVYFKNNIGYQVSYKDTLSEAKLLLKKLNNQGIDNNSIIVAVLETPRDFIPLLWACLLGGIPICPIIPRNTESDKWKALLSHLTHLFNNPTFIASNRHAELFSPNTTFLSLQELQATAPLNDSVASTNQITPETIALLMLTSGSTGLPKAVVLTHGNIIHSLKGKQQAQALDESSTILNWINFDHVAAILETHLLPLFCGASQLQLTPETIISDPLVLIELVSQYSVSMSFAPNFLFGQIVAASKKANFATRMSNIDLKGFRHFISGGEAMVCSTSRQFIAALKPYGLPDDALWPGFGMTETCAGSIYYPNFSNATEGEFAPLGWPIPGLEMRIDSSASQTSSAPGELQLKGPMIANRYYGNPTATDQAFTSDGWFKTGDIGVITEQEGLQLVGRLKDSIIVNGINHFLHEIETTIEQVDGTTPSFVAAFPTRSPGADTEELIVFYTPQESQNTFEHLYKTNIAIRNLIILQYGFRPALILAVPQALLSKTSLGKIQRSDLRKKFEEGFYTELIENNKKIIPHGITPIVSADTALEQNIIDIFSETMNIPTKDISVTESFFMLGGTSLELLKLLVLIKERIPDAPELSVIDMLRGPSPREIAQKIEDTHHSSQHYNPIVPLQSSGENPPIFCIHPGVGEILVFINLANFFAEDRPFYAIRARGFNKGEPLFASLDELVSTYVNAIKETQPKGPYLIAGYSYGGPVALPIAQRLEAQGERVAIAIIDAPPVIKHPRGEVDRVESALMLAFFLSFIGKDELDSLADKLRAHPEINAAEYLFDLAPENRVLQLGLNQSKFIHWAEIAFGLSQIGRDYEPQGTVEQVSVFYATPLWGDKDTYLEQQLKLWQQHSRTPVRYIDVPGEHHTMLDPTFVGHFQKIFRDHLATLFEDRT